MAKPNRAAWHLWLLLISGPMALTSLALAQTATQPAPLAQELSKDPPFAEGAPGKPYRVLGSKRFAFDIRSLAFSRDGKVLAAAGYGNANKVAIVDVASGQTVVQLDDHSGSMPALVFSPDGKYLYAGAQFRNPVPPLVTNAVVNVWDLTAGKSHKEIRADLWDLSANGKTLITIENQITFFDRGFKRGEPPPPSFTVRLWDTATLKETGKIESKGVFLTTLCVSADAKSLALAASDCSIRMLDLQTRKETRRIETPKRGKEAGEAVTFMAFNHDGKTLASVTDTIFMNGVPRVVQLWDVATGKAIQTLAGPKAPLTGMAFTPEGDQLIFTNQDHSWHVFDVATGTIVRSFGRDNVREFELSPNGRILATLSRKDLPGYAVAEKSVRLWDVATGEELGQIAGDPPAAYRLHFTSDSRALFVQQTNDNGRFGIWELSTRQMRASIPGGSPYALSNNERLIAYQIGTGTIAVWDLTGRNTGGVLDVTPLKASELTKLWNELQGNASESYGAILRLAGVPDQTVPFMEEKLRAIAALDKKRIGALFADRPCSPEQVLALRIVEVLEQCGTRPACKLLETLASDEKPQFTDAAREALGRLKKL